jgi:hypothetical protein
MVPKIQATVPSPPAATTLKFARKYAACVSSDSFTQTVLNPTAKFLLCSSRQP